LVTIFSQIERDWLKAVQQKDEATLSRLLAEDFEVWTPAAPGDPIPHQEWLRQALAEKIDSFRIRQMAVKGLNDNTAIASFVLTESVERAGKPHTSNFFVVDVWQKKNNNDESWQVTDRYLSEVKAVSAAQQGDFKPTGKN
jgi:ketosteroid isomerase-like protein